MVDQPEVRLMWLLGVWALLLRPCHGQCGASTPRLLASSHPNMYINYQNWPREPFGSGSTVNTDKFQLKQDICQYLAEKDVFVNLLDLVDDESLLATELCRPRCIQRLYINKRTADTCALFRNPVRWQPFTQFIDQDVDSEMNCAALALPPNQPDYDNHIFFNNIHEALVHNMTYDHQAFYAQLHGLNVKALWFLNLFLMDEHFYSDGIPNMVNDILTFKDTVEKVAITGVSAAATWNLQYSEEHYGQLVRALHQIEHLKHLIIVYTKMAGSFGNATVSDAQASQLQSLSMSQVGASFSRLDVGMPWLSRAVNLVALRFDRVYFEQQQRWAPQTVPFLANMPRLESLNILYFNISDRLSASLLSNNKQLRIFECIGCTFESVDEDAFEGLNKLMHVSLAGNPLTTLPGQLFKPVPQLASLDIRSAQQGMRGAVNMNYQTLMHMFGQVTLMYMRPHPDYVMPQMQRLPDELFEPVPQLKYLQLAGFNDSFEWRAELFRPLRRLVALDLGDNNFSSIDLLEHMLPACHLKYLSLAHNQMAAGGWLGDGRSVFAMPRLQYPLFATAYPPDRFFAMHPAEQSNAVLSRLEAPMLYWLNRNTELQLLMQRQLLLPDAANKAVELDECEQNVVLQITTGSPYAGGSAACHNRHTQLVRQYDRMRQQYDKYDEHCAEVLAGDAGRASVAVGWWLLLLLGLCWGLL